MIGVPLQIIRSASLIALSTGTANAAAANNIEFLPEVIYESRDIAVGEEPGMWCTHPNDPNQIIGITSAPETTTDEGNFIRQHYIVRRSENGGRTWTQTLRTSAAPMEIDPACTYGTDGQVFISAMSNFGGKYDGANVWRSRDGGRTWDPPSRIDHARFFDRPFLNVDLGNTPYRGRLYVVGWGKSFPGDSLQRPNEMVVYTSDDGGQSFNSQAAVPTNDTGRGSVHPGEATILPDGTYIISWAELDMDIDYENAKYRPSPGASTIKIARSVDGGRSFERPIEVAKAKWRMQSEGRDISVSKHYPTITVDRSGGRFNGNIYIAWADASGGRQQIAFSRSIDGGLSWEASKVLSEGHAFNAAEPGVGPHNKMVVMRVSSEGVIGALYYAQRTPDPDVQFQSVFTASQDGGLTWLSPEPVLTKPIRYRELTLNWDCTRLTPQQRLVQPVRCEFPTRTSVPNCLYGLASDAAGAFYIFAFSNAEGRPSYTMRTAKVSGGLERREEIDAAVHIDMETVSYDPELQLVVARATVTNVSARELRLPIRLVVDSAGNNALLDQKIELLNSDNGRTTAGAWWDFKNSSGSRTLAVGERSLPRELKIRFTGRLRTSISSQPHMTLQLRTYATANTDVQQNRSTALERH